MKIKEFKNGACVISERNPINGMTTVIARDSSGNVLDKIRCDTASGAREYFRAFCKLARATA